jgi:UDP-N-acetylglucosamine 4,6-dehydratase
MTRFIISPEQATKLIFDAIKYAAGGEIFVPRLPAFKVTDLIAILKEKHEANNEGRGHRHSTRREDPRAHDK